MQSLVIVGAGGHAREILDLVVAQNQTRATWGVRGMLVDPEFAAEAAEAEGWSGPPLLGDLDWLDAERLRTCWMIVAIGEPAARARVVGELDALGARYATLIHPSALVGSRVTLGEGVVIGAKSVLTCDITVGRHAHVNVASSISHDCRIDEFAMLAPGVHFAGGVHICAGADIGTGVNVIPGVEIGAAAVVGAGSTVIRNVEPGVTVVGAPARPI